MIYLKIIENFNSKNFKITELESQLKEKDVIISEYHAKMLADKESYFEVVEAHDELKAQLKEVEEEIQQDEIAKVYYCNSCGAMFEEECICDDDII